MIKISRCDNCPKRIKPSPSDSFTLGISKIEALERGEACDDYKKCKEPRVNIVVFGPSNPKKGDMSKLFERLNKENPPFKIITSTCGGWDHFGRKYAIENKNRGVSLEKFKAKIKEKGWEKGVFECNEEMAKIADFGITQKGAKTKGTSNMVETMKKLNKKVIYL